MPHFAISRNPHARGLRFILYVAVLICTFASFVHFAEAQEDGVTDGIPGIDKLYRGYIEANGGYLNIEALHSTAIKALLTPVEGASTTMEIYRKRPDKLRLRMTFENYLEEWIYNGSEGWLERTSLQGYPLELKRLSAAEIEIARQMCRLEGAFFHVGQREKNIASIVKEPVNGTPTYRIELDPDSGLAYETIWLDVDTLHEVKLARRVDRRGKPVLEEIYLEDLADAEGHAFHLKQVVYVDGEFESTLAVQSVRVNIGIFDEYFQVD